MGLLALYFLVKLRKPEKVDTPEDFHVILVGSGISGICMGKKLNDMGIKYTIIEKDKDLGGTWYENTYPSCACDVQSHLYSLSFCLNPDWTRAYSKQPEILEYLKSAACRFGVYPHIKFGRRVKVNTWDQDTSKWTVETTEGEKFTGDVLISCAGALHVPKIPDILGLDTFKGDIFHTAQWKADFSPKGKKIAVIGTGATSVQCLPGLAKMDPKELTVFQRTPCWVPPRLDGEYPDWLKTIFRYVPLTMVAYRNFIFWRGEFRFRVIFNSQHWIAKLMSKNVHELVRKHIRSVVKDPETAEKLIPNFSMGAKRITPSDYYLQAYNKENVHLVTEKIKGLSEKGVVMEGGVEKEFDAVVLATGFDLDKSAHPFEMRGLDPEIKDGYGGSYPAAHLGITHPNHPNFFILLGPGTGLGHNSIIYMIECQANYVCKGLKLMLEKKAKSVVLKPEVLNNFKDFVQENMKGKVFADNSEVAGWYRNKEGVNWTLWPLDLTSYWWHTVSFVQSQYYFKN